MNQALPRKTRNRRTAGNRAPAIRNSKAEQNTSTEKAKELQVQRLMTFLRCSEAVATTLAFHVYGEARS
jgi:hypothetical protein